MTSGGPARRVNATKAGSQPSPKTGNSRRITARLGMTRTAATAPTSVEVNFPPIDASTPIGMNMSMAMPSAPKLNKRWTSMACWTRLAF